jgi:hypothetical protein
MSESIATDDPEIIAAPKRRGPARRSHSVRGPRESAETVREEFIDPETGKPYRRRSNASNASNGFELRPESKKPGWDYQWEPIKVLNEPVDNAAFTALHDGGWRVVHPREMPEECPPGWVESGKNTIERGSQVLYKRPLYLTQEAKADNARRAQEQLEHKFAQAQMAPPGTAPRPRHVNQVVSEMEPLPADLRAQYEGTPEFEEV